MTYELAKQLKDAGFLQNGDGKYQTEKMQSVYDNGKESHLRYSVRTYNEKFYIPTLSELIASVGYKGFVMWELEGKFYAGKDEDACRGVNYYDDYPYPLEEGSTPEEAVAKLWLALNSK
jgi:hypothetical protein